MVGASQPDQDRRRARDNSTDHAEPPIALGAAEYIAASATGRFPFKCAATHERSTRESSNGRSQESATCPMRPSCSRAADERIRCRCRRRRAGARSKGNRRCGDESVRRPTRASTELGARSRFSQAGLNVRAPQRTHSEAYRQAGSSRSTRETMPPSEGDQKLDTTIVSVRYDASHSCESAAAQPSASLTRGSRLPKRSAQFSQSVRNSGQCFCSQTVQICDCAPEVS